VEHQEHCCGCGHPPRRVFDGKSADVLDPRLRAVLMMVLMLMMPILGLQTVLNTLTNGCTASLPLLSILTVGVLVAVVTGVRNGSIVFHTRRVSS
jgi:hypothetical protein